MAFYLQAGSLLDALAAALAERLAASPPADPLDGELIVVQSQGVARWLKLELARRQPLCAGLECLYPGAFLEQWLFAPMRRAAAASPPGDESELPFAPASVRWSLFALLAEFEPAPAFARVRAFVRDDPRRRFQLACRLARLFDRTMTYRQETLEAWELGRAAPGVAGEDARWQQPLWQALVARSRGPRGELRHFSGLCLDLLRRLAARDSAFLDPLRARRRVSYFGFSALPPAHLQIAWALAMTGVVDVDFYHHNPCAVDWSDAIGRKGQLRDWQQLALLIDRTDPAAYVVVSNPLLGAWGRPGREFFRLLLELEGVVEAPLFLGRPPPTEQDSLLVTLQHDIEQNRPLPPPGAPRPPLRPDDDSLTLHACHTPQREVEVLRDYLLDAFARDAALRPRDVRAYLPDLAGYAPYIEAVFGATRPGETGHIPFVIADKSLAEAFPECRAFLALLQTLAGRFTSGEVLGLLDVAAIRRRFGLEPADVEILKRLLAHARLAWGLDADFREALGASRDPLNTWRFALDRLILGAAMSLPPPQPPLRLDDVPCLPLDEAEPHAGIVGRLADFIEALAAARAQLAGGAPRPAAAWLDALRGWRDSFFDAREPDATDGLLALSEALHRLERQLRQTACDALPLPLDVLREALADELDGRPQRERFISGAVTFCRFQPMRNVPAAIVALLGMHDGAFPRVESRHSFDIMDDRQRRLGDSATRDDDRACFLDALLAAQRRLFISYVGQDDKDNQPRPPSVLVGDLLDTCDARFAATPRPSAQLTLRHPLQPFSPAYFRDAARRPRTLASRSREAFELASALAAGSSELSASSDRPDLSGSSDASDLSLDTLVDFLTAPCKHYYTRRLGIRLELAADEEPADEEPFALDALDRFTLHETLLAALLAASATGGDDERIAAAWRRRCAADGTLPRPAAVPFDEAWDKARTLAAAVRATVDLTQPPAGRELRLDLAPQGLLAGSVTLHTLPGDLGAAPASWRPAGEKPRDLLRAWVRHLALAADSSPAATLHLSLDRDRVSCRRFKPLAADAARAQLVALLDCYLQGRRQPLCFWPPAALAWLQAKDPAKARAAARERWEPEAFHSSPADAYTRRAFGDELPDEDSPKWREFTRLASLILLPALQGSDVAKVDRGGA